jgi:hypothetical protein
MDIIITGSGSPLRECRELLVRAGFVVGKDLSEDDRCPVILGEVPHLFSQALQMVETGRHLLIANPENLSASQLASVLASRKPRQAVFLWSERRHHPAYKLVKGLTRADEHGWGPRHLRLSVLSSERATAALLRWRACESLALLLELSREEARTLSAFRAIGASRAAGDFLSVVLELDGIQGFVDTGLGEGRERREVILAANERKIYIDELDPRAPVHLVDDGETRPAAGRRVSCTSPVGAALARQQCLTFLEGANSASRSQAEADTWLGVMACWQAIEASLAAQGASVMVKEPAAAGLRVIRGRRSADAGWLSPLNSVS